MVKLRVIIFLLIACVFAAVHYVAMAASLYWYYWWFDLVMHFWGGLLIGFGLHALATFSFLRIRPSTALVVAILFAVTISWEVFEFIFGLYDMTAYIQDTIIDITLGFSGGLLAHGILSTLYNRKV